MKAAIDNFVNSSFQLRGNTGLVVGVLQGEQSTVFGYGTISERNEKTPGGGTLYDIASLTKVFTSALLSVHVMEGSLDWDDRVRDLMPELSNFPPEITLIRIATHASGLPTMPGNVLASMRQDRNNPFAAYSVADLFKYLTNFRPRRKVPAKLKYSNVAFALLGHTLAQKQVTSYEQAIASKICGLLSMPDTRVQLSQDQMARLAPPHNPNGTPGHRWDLPAFEGAGALHSTADDQLKFLAAHLGSHQSPLTEALQACHHIHPGVFPPPLGKLHALLIASFWKERDIRPYLQDRGVGWEVGRLLSSGKRVYWRHGGNPGYQAFMGFVKDTSTGVVVLSNLGLSKLDAMIYMSSADQVGFRVLEHLVS